MIVRYICLIISLLHISILTSAQTVVMGKVTDAGTGDPIPFANVYFSGTQQGITTDFEGYYRIQSNEKVDSVSFSYVGYTSKIIGIDFGIVQTINIQLEENVINLNEVVVLAGENPAYAIMREVVRNKKKNDKRNLEAYEYESYTKIEIDIDKVDEKFSKSKIVRRISSVMDSIEILAGEDGSPIMPILFTEAISKFYYKRNPRFRHEEMIKTKVSGVGISDGTLTSQFIGSTFQEYNFYQNWLSIVDKNFISPLADGWKGSYEYYLTDSIVLEGDEVYQIEFLPKREQDLAFSGTIWITKMDYALKQADLSVYRTANLNFLEKIKIQQELERSEAGGWIPKKTRVLLDLGEIRKNTPGILSKFYISNKNIKVNAPYEDRFYQLPVVMSEDVREDSEDYWSTIRHDSLSSTEVNVYRMIDTLKTDPFIKNVSSLSKFAVNAYHPVGFIDIGPYTGFYSDNNIEGLRLGFGLRTNLKFSNKWVISAYGGYGFGDERAKYDASIKRIIKRQPWTTLTVQRKYEIDPIWILNDEISPLSLFYAFSRFGTLSDPFSHTTNSIDFKTQSGPGWINRILVKQQEFDSEFNFQYLDTPGDPSSINQSTIRTTEVNFETRYAKDELYVINDNERLSMGAVRYPVFILRYTLGLKGLLNGDFNYHKLTGNIYKQQKMGVFGTSFISVHGGYFFNSLPYPLLKAHIGNETPFYTGFAYNLMNYYEFSSDHYASFQLRHQFQGLLLNRIPLMKKLKWRLTATANILAGGMRSENLDRVVLIDDGSGNQVLPFKTLNKGPYIELGYGVENIFKFFRVDMFHRLSYLDQASVRRFGVKFTIQVIL